MCHKYVKNSVSALALFFSGISLLAAIALLISSFVPFSSITAPARLKTSLIKEISSVSAPPKYRMILTNISSTLITPDIFVTYLRNFTNTNYVFNNVSPLQPGESKEIEIEVDTHFDKINFGKLDVEIKEKNSVLTRVSQPFVALKNENLENSWIVLSGLTVGTSMLIASRFI